MKRVDILAAAAAVAIISACTLAPCTRSKVASAAADNFGSTIAVDTCSKYELIWSDEFDGDEVNAAFWSFDEGYIANDELQDYKKSGNHTVSNGTLKITAKKINDNKEFGSYTSARLQSHGKKSFTYGRIEARMKLPTGTGTWPAFWMLGDTIMQGGRWPACGEIDIMEYVGYDPQVVWGTIHSAANNHMNDTQVGGSTIVEGEDRWHTYGILWREQGIQYYVDSPENIYFEVAAPEVKTAENWPFDKPHFLLLNLAIGGMWGGKEGVDNSIFDTTMEVDYVRVYAIK